MADISRTEVASLIEENYSDTLLTGAAANSTVLAAFPTVNMGTKTSNLPVLASLAEADWVGESATESDGVKPTSQVTWANKTLVAEEIAVIIPVHENVLDDASVDILSEITTDAARAIGKKLDQAVLFGTDKPASWTSDALFPAAVAASQTFEVVDGTANEDDLYGTFLQAAGAVAEAGYAPDTFLHSLALQYRLANVRDQNGQRVFTDAGFDGLNRFANRNGAWNSASALGLVVDSSRVRIGVRQDITVKFLDQATVGGINLAERDMVALRFKARYAYVLGNGVTSIGASQSPVAAITPDATS